MRVDFDRPLAHDNYKNVRKSDCFANIDYENHAQNSVRKNISKGLTGKKKSDQHRKNMSKAQKGVSKPWKQRKAMSEAAKRRWAKKRAENEGGY